MPTDWGAFRSLDLSELLSVLNSALNSVPFHLTAPGPVGIIQSQGSQGTLEQEAYFFYGLGREVGQRARVQLWAGWRQTLPWSSKWPFSPIISHQAWQQPWQTVLFVLH